jgi:hypothetical protein
MTSNFPSSLDNFTNPTPADNLNTPQVLHSDQHANSNDAIEAIEAWVGISGTSEQASHEYRIKSLEVKPFPQELIGVYGLDDGVPLGTGTWIDFGDNLTATISGTVLRLDAASSQGGGAQFGVVGWDEGRFVGTGSVLNVTETDLNLSRSGTVLELSRATGTTVYLGVNGSRLFTYTASGTWLIISNSQDPQELIGIYNLSNGVPVGTGSSMGTGTWIDWGNNLSVSMSGTTLRVNVSPFPQELIGVYGKDEGQNVGTGTIFNVVGDNISLSLSGTTLTLNHTNPAFPQEVIGVFGQDEGTPLGTGTVLNVVGDNISMSLSGTVLRILHSDPPFPQEVIGIYGQDEGIPLGTGTTLNVTGENVAMSLSGTVLNIHHTNPATAFPQSQIGVMGWDEGIPIGTGTILNFTGDNVTATRSGTVINVNVTASAGEAFPVGSIFTSVVSTNPGTLLGYGTWAAFGAGRVLVGINAGDADFDTVKETGGAKTHTLTAAEMPVHTHTQDAHSHNISQVRSATTGAATTLIARTSDTSSTLGADVSTDNATAVNQDAGSGSAHNNVQPYIVVYFWERTA